MTNSKIRNFFETLRSMKVAWGQVSRGELSGGQVAWGPNIRGRSIRGRSIRGEFVRGPTIRGATIRIPKNISARNIFLLCEIMLNNSVVSEHSNFNMLFYNSFINALFLLIQQIIFSISPIIFFNINVVFTCGSGRCQKNLGNAKRNW